MLWTRAGVVLPILLLRHPPYRQLHLSWKRNFSPAPHVPPSAVHGHVPPKLKISVLGANGMIGQSLCLLLKHSTILTDLSLYDITGAPGVAADLSHIETRVKVRGFTGCHNLPECLEESDIVAISAGIPRKHGMAREDLFVTNAGILHELIYAVAATCPDATIAIISNPVNSLVPVACEVLKQTGCFNPFRLFGVTTLDVVRANTFIAEAKGLDPAHVYIPVIGGHSGSTVIPVFSQVRPRLTFEPEEMVKLTERIQEAGDEILKSKEGQASSTLSMAYAGARFCYSLMRAMRGEGEVIECAYIKTDAEEASYFATQILLGPNGLEQNLGVGKLSAFEKELMHKALPVLKRDIERGEKYAKDKKQR